MKNISCSAIVLLILMVTFGVWATATTHNVAWLLGFGISVILALWILMVFPANKKSVQKSIKESFEKEWERMTEEDEELDD